MAVPEGERVRRPATEAEVRALASTVRLQILRMTLDEPLTNKELSERLGRDPASVLHHVRTLVRTGFLEALPVRRGVRGAREVPYRSTRRSWELDTGSAAGSMVEAFLAEVAGAPAEDAFMSRLGLRLSERDRAELQQRLQSLLDDFADRPQDGSGRAWSLFVSLHPDPTRDAP